MFVDSAQIVVSSGNGGAGASSFRREKFVIQGGPDGGDGGKGGDVIFKVSQNTDTLSKFRGTKHHKAQHGAQGESRNKTGKSGADLILEVPCGTQIINADTNELLCDLNKLDSSVVLLKGGKGGLGNSHFKNSINQAPTYAQKGLPGVTLNIKLELKLIADVGLVGYPNVGKSSLISSISNAKPEVANYEFTTLTPHLGVVDVDEFNSFVMADIPGIIEGASSGKGLGLEFLKHIERTKFLLFVLDSVREMSLKDQFLNLKKELKNFSSLLDSSPFGIVISKADALESSELERLFNDFAFMFDLEKTNELCYEFRDYKRESKPIFILAISSISHLNLNKLKGLIKNALDSSE